MKTIPQKYKTSDGMEFEDIGQAERHEAVVTATADCERAFNVLEKLRGEEVMTADGQPLKWGWRAYYHVVDRIGGESWYTAVNLWPSYCFVRVENGRVYVIERGYDKDNRYELRNLYAEEKNAVARVIALCEEQSQALQEKVGELREKWGL